VIDPGAFGGGADYTLFREAAGGAAFPDDGAKACVLEIFHPSATQIQSYSVGEIGGGLAGLPAGRLQALHAIYFDSAEKFAVTGDFVEESATLFGGSAEERREHEIQDDHGGERKFKCERIRSHAAGEQRDAHGDQNEKDGVAIVTGIERRAKVRLMAEHDEPDNAEKKDEEEGPTHDFVGDGEEQKIERAERAKERIEKMVVKIGGLIFLGERVVKCCGELAEDPVVPRGKEEGVFRELGVGAQASGERSGSALIEVEHFIVDGGFFAREAGGKGLGGSEDCVVFVESLESDEAAGGEMDDGGGDGFGIERASQAKAERAGGEILRRGVLDDGGAGFGV